MAMSTIDDDRGQEMRIMGVSIPKERAIAGCFIALAIFCAAPIKIIGSLWHIFLTTVGMAAGVGVGLGLAMHVYERLQSMQNAHDGTTMYSPTTTTKKRRSSLEKNIKPAKATGRMTSRLEDGTSYAALMTSAGYYVGDKILRGQVLKEDDSFWDIEYRFTGVPVDQQHGPKLFQEDWPSLPVPVARELGRLVEHVVRDQISTWYSRLDPGCIFLDEKQRRLDGIPRDGGQLPLPPTTTSVTMSPASTETKTIESNSGSDDDNLQTSKGAEADRRRSRKMVFSTRVHRYIPMLDQTYKTLSAAVGTLATRAEHVNVFSLALLKYTHVLAHTFKVYRTLRGIAQTKNATANPTEIQVTREFLLAGKLHRAVTFGLDVPSLLFADKTGQECGTGTDKAPLNPDQVLEQRLFGTRILADCELDYNRVLAHRLIRAMIPKSDSNSHVTLALIVEIFGSVVLQSLMNLWIPSFLNNIIKRATANKGPAADANSGASASELPDHEARQTDPPAVATRKKTTDGFQKSCSSIDVETRSLSGQLEITGSTVDGTSEPRSGVHSPSLTKETTNTPTNVSIDFRNDSLHSDFDQMNNIADQATFSSGEIILKLTSIALQDMETFMDFEQCRLARAKNIETEVDWDDPLCQEAVLKLVIVLEAAILHGRTLPLKRPPIKISNGEEDALDVSSSENTSMEQILMQM